MRGDKRGGHKRGEFLEKVADLYERNRERLMAVIVPGSRQNAR